MHILVRALLGLVVSLTVVACSTPQMVGKVVGVTDGDTVKVLLDNKEVTVRLFAIDAPETSCHAWASASADSRCVDKAQPFGKAAKRYLSDLAFGKTVTVRPTGEFAQKRTVATLWLGELDLNLEMVKAGYACHYATYAKRHQSAEQFAQYAQAEAAARQRKLGQWQDANARCGWQFRHQQGQSTP